MTASDCVFPKEPAHDEVEALEASRVSQLFGQAEVLPMAEALAKHSTAVGKKPPQAGAGQQVGQSIDELIEAVRNVRLAAAAHARDDSADDASNENDQRVNVKHHKTSSRLSEETEIALRTDGPITMHPSEAS